MWTAGIKIHPNPEPCITLHNLSFLDDMVRSCGTYGVQDRCLQVYGGGDLMERNHLVDLGVDVRIII
jgi:hypothetical protein